MSAKGKILAGLASLTLFDVAASLPVKAEVNAPPVSAPSWEGAYIGGHAGYRWADANFSSAVYSFNIPSSGLNSFLARNENYGLNSGIVGVQAGYNFMLSPALLAGVEGDWSWGSGKNTTSAAFTIFDGTGLRSSEVDLTWQATIRGRLGVVNGPWLLYGTGGVAFAHAKWSDSISASGAVVPAVANAASASQTLTGWVVGAGAEHMLTKNWLARVEYLYERFDSFNVPHGFGPQTGTLDIRDVQKMRFGVSYKFGP